MPCSPSLVSVSAAILMVAAPVLSAEGKEVIIPDENVRANEKATKTAPNSEELLKIIAKQEILIKALKARIDELEQANGASPSPTSAGNK